jgi:hypothetical protein
VKRPLPPGWADRDTYYHRPGFLSLLGKVGDRLSELSPGDQGPVH